MPVSMRLPRFGHVRAGQIAWTVAIALVLGYVFGASDTLLIPLGVIGGVGLIAFGFASPAAFVAIFLLLRPLLDDYSSKGSSGLNPGGALGALVIVVAVAYALTHKKLQLPRAT